MIIFYLHIEESGIEKKIVLEIDENNFSSDYRGNAPAFCLYFGNKKDDFKNRDILERLI